MKKVLIAAALVLMLSTAVAEDAILKAFNDDGYHAVRVEDTLYLTIEVDPSLKLSEFENLDFSSLGGKAKPEEYKAYLHTLKRFYVFVTQNGVSSICIEWINPDQTGEVTNSLISTDKISELF